MPPPPPLPTLAPDDVFADATLLEVDSPARLLRYASDPKIARFLLARVNDTCALVDPDSAHALLEALRAQGETPKIVRAGR